MAAPKHSKRIRNRYNHTWQTVTASSEDRLEKRTDEYHMKWDKEHRAEELCHETERRNDDLQSEYEYLKSLCYIDLYPLTPDKYRQKNLSKVSLNKRKRPTLLEVEKEVGINSFKRLLGKIPGPPKASYDDLRRKAVGIWIDKTKTYDKRIEEEKNDPQSAYSKKAAQLDSFIADLSQGDASAVCTYFRYALTHDHFHINTEYDFDANYHEFRFSPDTGELSFSCRIPNETEIPIIKNYKYNDKTEEIESTMYDAKASTDWRLQIMAASLLRAASLVFLSDTYDRIKSVTILGIIRYFDSGFGNYQQKKVVRFTLTHDIFEKLTLEEVNPLTLLKRVLNAKFAEGLYSKEPCDLKEIN